MNVRREKTPSHAHFWSAHVVLWSRSWRRERHVTNLIATIFSSKNRKSDVTNQGKTCHMRKMNKMFTTLVHRYLWRNGWQTLRTCGVFLFDWKTVRKKSHSWSLIDASEEKIGGNCVFQRTDNQKRQVPWESRQLNGPMTDFSVKTTYGKVQCSVFIVFQIHIQSTQWREWEKDRDWERSRQK